MWLIHRHPQVAFRDCAHCQRFVYDEETGQPQTINRGTMLVPRNQHNPPPCRLERGCAKGTPEQPVTLNPANEQAWEFHKQCKAVGQFPADALVRQNAAIIEDIAEQQQRLHQRKVDLLLELLSKRP